MNIPVAVIRGPKSGPTLALVAGRMGPSMRPSLRSKSLSGTQSRGYFRDGHHRPIGEHRFI